MPFRARIAAPLALAMLATCTREPTTPASHAARLAVAPVFPNFASGLSLSIDQARITVVRPPADTLARRLITFPAGQDTISPNIQVTLEQDSEDVDVTIELLAAGTVVFTGTQTVIAQSSGSVTPIPIPLAYQEPGAHVTSLTIGPRDSALGLKDTLHLRVAATDSGANPVSQFYVLWSVSDSTAATVSKSGVVIAGASRRTVYVRAQIPPTSLAPLGVIDSTSVVVVPTPTQIARVSGDSQAAPVSSALQVPFTAVVRAADNLPVPDVLVTFSATTGGGSVVPLTAVTDSAGLASATGTLGATVGANTFTASINGGGASTTFDATGLPLGPVIANWTGAVSTDWSVAGNWNPALVPTAADDVTIASGPVNQPVLTQAVSVKNVTVGASASITTAGQTFSVAGNLTASGAIVGTGDVLMTGSGVTLQGSLPNVDINSSGTVTLTGTTTLSGNLTLAGGDLVVGGQALGIAGGLSFATLNVEFLTETNPADSVDVAGPVTWNPNSDGTGHLTNGVLVLRGTFFQGGTSSDPFAATGAHRTVFAGTGLQTIDPRGSGFQFQNLEIRGSGTVTLSSPVLVVGRTSVLSATTVNGSTLTSLGRLSTIGGSTFAPNFLTIDADSLAIAGTYGVGTTTITNGSTLPVLTYGSLDINRPAGTITLAGNTNLSGSLTIDGGELLVAGHALGMAGGLTLSTGSNVFLTMTNPADSVDVGGSTNWDAGGDHTGHLTAGVLVMRGTFFQGGPIANAFVATAAHREVFDGTVPQTIDPRGGGFQFQTFELRGTGTVTLSSPVLVVGRTSVLSATTVNGSSLTSLGRLSTIGGSTFAPNFLTIDSDSLAIGGTYGVGNTTFTNGSTVPVLTYGSVDINRPAGTMTLVGNTTLSGDLTIDGGELLVAGHSLVVAGGLSLTGASTVFLTMTNVADSIDVGGPIAWGAGGTHTGHLTAGVLVARSTFFQGGPNDTAFAASGTHRVVFDGTAAQSIDPRGAAFHFQNLQLKGTGGISLNSNTTVAGQFISTTPGVTLIGGSITVASVNVDGLTLQGVAFHLIEPVGATETFDNATFTGYSTNVTQLLVQGPGGAAAPRTLTFNNLTFMPLATGDLGTYVSLFSSNGFFINLNLPGASQSPSLGGNGPLFSTPPNQTTLSGATILWP